MQIDLKTLRERVLETVKRSPIGDQVEDVVLESDHDDDGAEFLRVIVQVKQDDEADDAIFEALLEDIESTVSAVDERYPSVRFSDAA
jgi:hypothetical protein